MSRQRRAARLVRRPTSSLASHLPNRRVLSSRRQISGYGAACLSGYATAQQAGYCRESGIYFYRPIQVDYTASLASSSQVEATNNPTNNFHYDNSDKNTCKHQREQQSYFLKSQAYYKPTQASQTTIVANNPNNKYYTAMDARPYRLCEPCSCLNTNKLDSNIKQTKETLNRQTVTTHATELTKSCLLQSLPQSSTIATPTSSTTPTAALTTPTTTLTTKTLTNTPDTNKELRVGVQHPTLTKSISNNNLPSRSSQQQASVQVKTKHCNEAEHCFARHQCICDKRHVTFTDKYKPLIQQPVAPNQDFNTMTAAQNMIDKSKEAALNQISLDEARYLLLAYVKKHSFWSSKAVRKMKLRILKTKTIYIISVQTYCERRNIEWRFEPYLVLSSYKFDKFTTQKVTFLKLEKSSAPSSQTNSTSLIEQTHANRDVINTNILWQLKPTSLPLALYEPHISSVEVPNTSFVKTCHCCSGRGKFSCKTCHGVGYEVCTGCMGSGTSSIFSSSRPMATQSTTHSTSCRGAGIHTALDTDDSSKRRECQETNNFDDSYDRDSAFFGDNLCKKCSGDGRKRCLTCTGSSYVRCEICQGCGRLRCYKNLTVIWQTFKDELIVNNDNKELLPNDLLRLSSGKLLMSKSAASLTPLKAEDLLDEPKMSDLFPEQNNNDEICVGADSKSELVEALCSSSEKILTKHIHKTKNTKVMEQRYFISSVECQFFSYNHKGKEGSFVVFGKQKQIYMPKYPFKVFNFCSIL